jgi:hypothetical protein
MAEIWSKSEKMSTIGLLGVPEFNSVNQETPIVFAFSTIIRNGIFVTG